MADPVPQLAPGVPVPVNLTASGSLALDVPSSGVLTVQLASGDIDVSVQSLDQNSSTDSTMSGSGVATISLSNSSGAHLSLSSNGGAQAIVSFGAGALPAIGIAPATTGSVVSSGGSNVVVSGGSAVSVSSSNVSVSHSVSVSGGSTASAQGGSVEIDD